MSIREETEAAHIAACDICAITPRIYRGCHHSLSDSPCPHPPVEAIDDTIVPEALRVCEWHLYVLAAPIAQQLQDYDAQEARLQALIRDPGPALEAEDIARGPDGGPVPDESVRQEARQLLAEIRDNRAMSRDQ